MKAGWTISIALAAVLAGCAGGEGPVRFVDARFEAYCLGQFDRDSDGMISAEEALAVEQICVSGDSVESLTGIERFPNLRVLDCSDNRLQALDVSRNPALVELNCGDNDLPALDISMNTSLVRLVCCANALTSLDVSRAPDLQVLWCDKNALTALDVSRNPALVELETDYNHLRILDLSHNPALEVLTCYDNPELAEIWLKHGHELRILFYRETPAEIKYMD